MTINGVAYMGAETGDFYAIDDASTGVTMWRKRLGDCQLFELRHRVERHGCARSGDRQANRLRRRG